MRQVSNSLIGEIFGAVLRVLCIAVPVVVALAAIVFIVKYEERRAFVPKEQTPGVTEPLGN
ncbi:hypothetical protein DEA98_22555 [Brucella pseudogrignonensis]|uniref:Uncharacterized protein n=1 Tax=Brucella pseudogrignonensis TaxID=419475 RepID=A0A7Y3WVQ7_9HYPH|nr:MULTISPECIES: hypothetical protein [Brucella]EMG52611.1 hypothetical protein WYI_16244 [Ochrobactrum sp. CDB2]MCM0752887.1 hypothetical protein [Brucella pseudogrignonensis]NNV19467.1 hypothetical protein [Brucella pseudogrignonensis]